MKKNAKIIYATEILLALYILWLNINISSITLQTKNVLSAIFFTIILTLLVFFFGIKKDKNYLKGTSVRIVIIALMLFLLTIYTLGFILGFNKGFVYTSPLSLIKNIVFVVLLTFEIELIRYIISKNSFQNKKMLIFFTILIILFNVFLEVNMGTLIKKNDKFIFLCTIILPVIASESLCSFMTYKAGVLPSLIYKLTMNLYIYLLPIVPDLGDYIYSVINIIMPFLVYNKLNNMFSKFDKEKERISKINKKAFAFSIVCILIILVTLISGIGNYKLIAIATNSMKPLYGRGDAVVYEKTKVENLKTGDILVFQKDNIVVTHRIIKIWKTGNEYSFVTKGDNNSVRDYYMPKSSDVLGKVKFSLKYIGYPTVLLNEQFGKE